MSIVLSPAAGFVGNEGHQRFSGCHDAAESGGVGAAGGGSSGGWRREVEGLQTHHTQLHEVNRGHPWK